MKLPKTLQNNKNIPYGIYFYINCEKCECLCAGCIVTSEELDAFYKIEECLNCLDCRGTDRRQIPFEEILHEDYYV